MNNKYKFIRRDFFITLIFILFLSLSFIQLNFNGMDLKERIVLTVFNVLFVTYIIFFLRQTFFSIFMRMVDNSKELNVFKGVDIAEKILFSAVVIVYSIVLVIYTSLEQKFLFLFLISFFFFCMLQSVLMLRRNSIYIGDQYLIYSEYKISIKDIKSFKSVDTQNKDRIKVELKLKDDTVIMIHTSTQNLLELKKTLKTDNDSL